MKTLAYQATQSRTVVTQTSGLMQWFNNLRNIEKREYELLQEMHKMHMPQQTTHKQYKKNNDVLTDEKYNEAAKSLGVEPEMLKAIGLQESKEKAFDPQTGRATIQYERHHMNSYLDDDGTLSKYQNNPRYADVVKAKQYVHPTKNNKNVPTSDKYVIQSATYERLQRAKEINKNFAIESTSWGRFQVLGSNYKMRYNSPEEMENAMQSSELEQFNYFVDYLRKTPGMVTALKTHNWRTIARLYNGKYWETANKDYAKNLEKFYYELKGNK